MLEIDVFMVSKKMIEKVKKEDPRIARTRKILQQAFLTLLQAHDYDDITVQNILDQAEVNRTTFYKHYLNKEALAIQIIDNFQSKILQPILEQRFTLSMEEFSKIATPLLQKYRTQMQVLLKINTRHINFRQITLTHIKQAFLQVVNHQKIIDKDLDLELQSTIFAHFSLVVMEYLIYNQKVLPLEYMMKNLREGVKIFLVEHNDD